MRRFLMSRFAVPVVATVAGGLSVLATLLITGHLGVDVHDTSTQRRPTITSEHREGTTGNAFPEHPYAPDEARVRYARPSSRSYDYSYMPEYYRQYFGLDEPDDEEEHVIVTAPPENGGGPGEPGEPGQPGVGGGGEGGDEGEGDGVGGPGGPGGDSGGDD
jgi:hypothetical protein